MLRKIRKLILHPNRYFYDYFRKKMGFRKYFVTDKIRLLDSSNHQKWHKALFSHPYLYLYYKFNKRLRKPAYPILVDYRIENIEKSAMGGGNRLVLAVELEKQNTIYFADPEIVQKVQDNKEPYLVGKIFKFNLTGSGNSILLDSKVRFGRNIKINFNGNNNKLYLDNNCKLISGSITLSGSSNSVYLGSQFNIKGGVINVLGSSNLINFGENCILNANTDVTFKGNDNTLNAISSIEFMPGSRIGFVKNNNYAYIGPDTKVLPTSKINFSGNNALLYICGKTRLNLPAGLVTNVIFFYGYGSTIGGNFSFQIREAKNIIIGSDCMFSAHIHIRNAAGHGIYDGDSRNRVAKGQTLIIGDHVWIGWGVMVVKGLNIGSGSMIGGGSVVSRNIPEKTLAVGNPAKAIRENILWVREEPYDSNGVMREEFETYTEPANKPTPIGWERLLEIDTIQSSTLAKEKAEIIHKILDD